MARSPAIAERTASCCPPSGSTTSSTCSPSECEKCWKSLPKIPDAFAPRYQQIELPPLSPYVKEWQRHAVTCCCGHSTRAAYDDEQIPASPFGPRLMALMALLTGVFHLSRRKATELLSDVVGVRVSLGALSVSKSFAKTKRHPTVEDNVVIYASAAILGGKTVIGHDSIIGGNVWLTESVPPHSVVYHSSKVTVRSKKPGGEPIDFQI